MADRWVDDHIHVYDYESDEIKREADRDAFAVASAFIYSDDERATLGILILVSGHELRTISKEDAVRRGRQVRDRLIQQLRQQARGVTVSRTMVFALDGRQLA